MGKLMIKGKPASGSFDKAENIKFNNTLSEIDATNVQDAINELLCNYRSHIGMIVQSTTLDTMEKVIAIYGGTTWSKIEGRFLLGQSSSYGINSTGGSTTNSHSHWQSFGYDGSTTGYADMGTSSRVVTKTRIAWNGGGGSSGATRENQTYSESISIMPPYKAVYIWERTA